MMDTRPGLLVLTNSLVAGGAEKHAITLLNQLDTQRFRLSGAWLKRDDTLLPQIDAQRLQALWCCEVARKLDWDAVRELAGQLDALRIDMIIAVNQYAALYALLAVRRCTRAIRVVEIFHTTLLLSLKERAQMWLYKSVFRRCSLLVYVSHNQQRYWRERGLRARAETVIHNGVDVARFAVAANPASARASRAEFAIADSDYLIGICASLRPEKAHGDLLAAIIRLRAAGIAARGLLIGDGPERARIERTIDAKGLRGIVHITGYRSDVRPLVAGCDVITLVSHGVETFSIAALEAMAMGKPIVMTDIGGAAEQVKTDLNGFLFAPGDIGALVRHLTALADPALRERLGSAARERVAECFTEQRMLSAYTNQFVALLAS